jgi:hypothetical protein
VYSDHKLLHLQPEHLPAPSTHLVCRKLESANMAQPGATRYTTKYGYRAAARAHTHRVYTDSHTWNKCGGELLLHSHDPQIPGGSLGKALEWRMNGIRVHKVLPEWPRTHQCTISLSTGCLCFSCELLTSTMFMSG